MNRFESQAKDERENGRMGEGETSYRFLGGVMKG